MVYAAVKTDEFVKAVLVPSALMVDVAATLIGVEYVAVGELSQVPGVPAPGVLPSIV